MDFSVTVPQEWLNRRRSQVAEASRKIRAKKKREEEELREENARLRAERTALLDKITELEKSIGSHAEHDEELENELLRTQLEQHKGFLKGFLEAIADVEPKEESSKGEVRFMQKTSGDATNKHPVAIETKQGFRIDARAETHFRVATQPQSGLEGSKTTYRRIFASWSS
jgi:hypothetical protein